MKPWEAFFIGKKQATERLQVDSVKEKWINNGFSDSHSLGVEANYRELRD